MGAAIGAGLIQEVRAAIAACDKQKPAITASTICLNILSNLLLPLPIC